MSMIRRGMQVPARWRLLACGLFLLASCSIAAAADEGIVDVHALPQLDGAVEDTSRPDPYRVEYRVPTPQAVTLPYPQSANCSAPTAGCPMCCLWRKRAPR